jgi:hypothetical protein
LKKKSSLGLIWIPAILAAAFLGMTLWLLHLGPGNEKPNVWKALEKDGPFVAGSWVLCAALLSLSAVGITLRASARDADELEARKKQDTRQLLRAEILAFWDRLNRLKLRSGLEDHVAWLKKLRGGSTADLPNVEEHAKGNLYRRSLGDEWFMISRSAPLVLAELPPDDTARYLSLAARSRHLVHRLTYLNGAPYTSQKPAFWINYHNDTLQVLNDLVEPTKEMLAALGETNADPDTFEID